MGVSLAEHDQLLLSTIRDHGGYVFASGGDGFAAAFSDPVAALRAAIETRAGLLLPVRMGLHTGTADERDGNYFGKTLNRGARVMAAGHGGQILMSDATASLVCDETRLTDLGVHRFAGLEAPLRLWQVGIEQHPALRTADGTPMVHRRTTPALPVSLFVGRDEDAARVAALLDTCRIVTVCGPGGVGKSRLVRHVAHSVAERYEDGVIWVDFSSMRDPADVPGALAAELRLNALVGDTIVARIVEVLAVRQQLVVFDTCEHLIEAVAALVESIGVAADRVDLLLTSREPLRADGEHVLTLAPLDESEAVALLIDRIQSTAPGTVSRAEDVGPRRGDRATRRPPPTGFGVGGRSGSGHGVAWVARRSRAALRGPVSGPPDRSRAPPLAHGCRRLVVPAPDPPPARPVHPSGSVRRAGRVGRHPKGMSWRRRGQPRVFGSCRPRGPVSGDRPSSAIRRPTGCSIRSGRSGAVSWPNRPWVRYEANIATGLSRWPMTRTQVKCPRTRAVRDADSTPTSPKSGTPTRS